MSARSAALGAGLVLAMALAFPASGCAALWRMGLRPPDGGRRCAPAAVDARTAPEGLRLHEQLRVRAPDADVDFGVVLVAERQDDALVFVVFDGFGAKLFSAVQRGTRTQVERAYGRRLPWPAENLLRDVQLARLGAVAPPGVTVERTVGADGRALARVRDERCGSETTIVGAGAGAGAPPEVSAPPAATVPPAAPADAPRPPSAAPGWRTFELPFAGFSVDLPGEPAHEVLSRETEAGPVEARAWRVETPDLVLRVEHHDIPRFAVMVLTDHRLLTMSASRLLEDRRGVELEREAWSLDGYPGLRLRYTRSGRGDTLEEARLVLVDRRLFIASARVTAPPGGDAAARATVRRFFESWSVWRSPSS